MKYIRTKDWDGIWEVVEETDMVYRVKARGKPHHVYSKSKCQTIVIKQADTIEKLCDEFVFIDDFFAREHRLAYSLENALARCKYHNVDVTTLRGAIWTDKGLIYVAKMNEKGELELL